jgi:hypothetical protein
MAKAVTKSVAKLERLSTALDAYTRASVAAVQSPSLETFRALPRAENALEDAAVECGMDRQHGDLTGWAARAVTRFLCAA